MFLRCSVLRVLWREHNRLKPLPQNASSLSPRELFCRVMQGLQLLANHRFAMTLQLYDRSDTSATLNSSPNSPDTFCTSWVSSGIAKIIASQNTVLLHGPVFSGT